MSKHEILTESEMSQYVLSKYILDSIEKCRLELGLEKGEMKVLDWGCGRGRTVAWLRERGYAAYGIDIDETPVKNGKPLLAARRLDADSLLRLLDGEGKASTYEDNQFHFVCSQQVLEHVKDLETAAGEMNRITLPGGAGIHLYPGHKYITEGHLYMPFVHWLPKNGLRKLLIHLYLIAGTDPGWKEFEGMSKSEKAREYYDYSIGYTFYRTWREVAGTFEKNGFDTEFLTVDKRNIARLGFMGKLLKIKPLFAAANLLYLNVFPDLGLETRKQVD